MVEPPIWQICSSNWINWIISTHKSCLSSFKKSWFWNHHPIYIYTTIMTHGFIPFMKETSNRPIFVCHSSWWGGCNARHLSQWETPHDSWFMCFNPPQKLVPPKNPTEVSEVDTFAPQQNRNLSRRCKMIAMNLSNSCEILYINLAWGDYITVDSIRLFWSVELEGSLWPKECFSRQQLLEKFAEISSESKLPCEALARKSTPQSSIQFIRFNKGVGVGLNKFLEPTKTW